MAWAVTRRPLVATSQVQSELRPRGPMMDKGAASAHQSLYNDAVSPWELTAMLTYSNTKDFHGRSNFCSYQVYDTFGATPTRP
jgi:hypothetical protein